MSTDSALTSPGSASAGTRRKRVVRFDLTQPPPEYSKSEGSAAKRRKIFRAAHVSAPSPVIIISDDENKVEIPKAPVIVISDDEDKVEIPKAPVIVISDDEDEVEIPKASETARSNSIEAQEKEKPDGNRTGRTCEICWETASIDVIVAPFGRVLCFDCSYRAAKAFSAAHNNQATTPR
ncbi:hypothetical protein RUND412_007258 [Rhizina undulata]